MEGKSVKFPSTYPREARQIAKQVENELTTSDRKALCASAAAMGREKWRDELRRLREVAFVLLAHPPSVWRAHFAQTSEDDRRLHLCCMLICAQEGAAFLEMLSIRAPHLAAGGGYRVTLSHAAKFVFDLDVEMPDPDWPLPDNPFVA
jgi:hypothetical protein